MSQILNYTIIDGIKCYSPEVANASEDFPESGFDIAENKDNKVWSQDFFWSNSRNRLFKRIVYNHLKSTGKTKYLEIGCATGEFIRQIVENENLEITGSEIYLKALVHARKNFPNVNFIQYDVTQGTIGEEFDLIVAFDVIEHIEDDTAAILNINKMLGKNGCLIITVPQHMFMWSRLDEILKHKRRYSRRELVTRLQASGFDIRYATSFLFILFPLMLISRIIDKGHSQTQPDKCDNLALKKRVHFPDFLNRIFDYFMRIDEFLIRMGISLPFGGTLVVVAKKR
jgi:2-polyprenyl-3-methyl-5-hydroxy-6-metoxy-1,4-benzoquinol methylase